MKKSQTNEEARAASLKLLRAAGWKMFSERGYRATSVEDIAREANLTKGAIYFYFGNKDKFAATLISEVTSPYVDDAIAAGEKMSTCQDSLVKMLHKQVNYAQAFPQQVLFFIMMAAELYFEPGESGTLIRQKYQGMRDYIERLVREGRAAGEFKGHAGPRELASFYMAAHDGMMLEWARRGTELDGSELVRIYRTGLLYVLTN